MRIDKFSDATLHHLGDKYYVYTLSDDDDNVFYVGKGKGNRVFSHELESKYFTGAELSEKISRIIELGDKVKRHIINYGLSEEGAFASENTLVQFLGLSNLTNKVSGHGNKKLTVEELERQFGYEPMSVKDIESNDLMLVVKLDNAFLLDEDDSVNYWTSEKLDLNNLKTRTLRAWKLDKNRAKKVKYVIGVNKSANLSVVSAFEIEETVLSKEKGRVEFHSTSNSVETQRKLGIYKKSFTDLKFGSGQSIAYVKPLKKAFGEGANQ